MMSGSRLLALVALLVAGASASGAAAQTSVSLDRSALAQQTSVDPLSGELLGVPPAYIGVRGAADRSELARRTDVDVETGELRGVPERYESPGAPDRAQLAQQTNVDDAGRIQEVPSQYADVKSFDRTALAQQLDVDVETGNIDAVPALYADVRGADRSDKAIESQIDLDTGRLDVVPGLYPTDYDADAHFDLADNCPYFANPDQADANGDRRGNVCECGDQNLSGVLNVNDLLAINGAIFDPSLVTPLCDANYDLLCNVSDIIGANRGIYVPKSTICERQPVPGPY
jgi:hypothetical protein